MNVYDFDKTIYQGDSTVDFWLHCIRHHPRIILFLPQVVLSGMRYKLGQFSKEQFKENFYRFLCYIPDVKDEVCKFWDFSLKKIEPWYLLQRHDEDLIISASPDFLISEICERLHVRCIASEVDHHTGRLLGPNCYGAEKVRRFEEIHPNKSIDGFYSDSKSDLPLAEKAAHSYLVRNGKIYSWPFGKGDSN